ncbi:hypothetical protein E4U27_007648 [Claviceps purpurea]|nr:hypothetical protein E4U27_007648 [Claviceps purpurea]
MTGQVYVNVDDRSTSLVQSLNVTRTKIAPEKADTAPKTDMSKKPDAIIYKGWTMVMTGQVHP